MSEVLTLITYFKNILRQCQTTSSADAFVHFTALVVFVTKIFRNRWSWKKLECVCFCRLKYVCQHAAFTTHAMLDRTLHSGICSGALWCQTIEWGTLCSVVNEYTGCVCFCNCFGSGCTWTECGSATCCLRRCDYYYYVLSWVIIGSLMFS